MLLVCLVVLRVPTCTRAQLAHHELAPRPVRCLHHEQPALAVHAHPFLADLPKQVDRLPRRFVEREPQLVRRKLFLERRTHAALAAEEAVRRHQSVDPLVRPKVVVVREEVREPLLRISQVLRLGALPELFAHALPQPLALPECLRVVRAAHHVLDAFADQQLLKRALAAPREVLPALIRQHLFGFAVARDPFEQGIDHQVRRLPRGEFPRHDVAAVVVEEDREVHTAVLTAKHEARDVALPQLARSRALEAAWQRR